MRLLKGLIAIIVVLLIFSAGTAAYAFDFGLFTPFGGRVLATIPCTCSPIIGTQIVTVGPPKGGVFLYTPITKAYKYYYPYVGRWILGIASNFRAPCMMGIPPFCVAAGTYKPITMFGTSAY